MYNYLSELTNWDWIDYQNEVLAGVVGAALATFIIIAIIVFIAIYVYFAAAWYTIAKRMKHKKPWLAWIPFANIALWLQLGGFHWAWVFLVLIPIAGWIALGVLFIISNWKVFEKLKYPGWLSLSPLLGIIAGGLGTIAYGVVIGFVAWKRKR